MKVSSVFLLSLFFINTAVESAEINKEVTKKSRFDDGGLPEEALSLIAEYCEDNPFKPLAPLTTYTWNLFKHKFSSAYLLRKRMKLANLKGFDGNDKGFQHVLKLFYQFKNKPHLFFNYLKDNVIGHFPSFELIKRPVTKYLLDSSDVAVMSQSERAEFNKDIVNFAVENDLPDLAIEADLNKTIRKYLSFQSFLPIEKIQSFFEYMKFRPDLIQKVVQYLKENSRYVLMLADFIKYCIHFEFPENFYTDLIPLVLIGQNKALRLVPAYFLDTDIFYLFKKRQYADIHRRVSVFIDMVYTGEEKIFSQFILDILFGDVQVIPAPLTNSLSMGQGFNSLTAASLARKKNLMSQISSLIPNVLLNYFRCIPQTPSTFDDTVFIKKHYFLYIDLFEIAIGSDKDKILKYIKSAENTNFLGLIAHYYEIESIEKLGNTFNVTFVAKSPLLIEYQVLERISLEVKCIGSGNFNWYEYLSGKKSKQNSF